MIGSYESIGSCSYYWCIYMLQLCDHPAVGVDVNKTPLGVVQSVFLVDKLACNEFALAPEYLALDFTANAAKQLMPLFVGSYFSCNGQHTPLFVAFTCSETSSMQALVLTQLARFLPTLTTTQVRTITTDADSASLPPEVLKKVFPNHCHRLCLWHIEKNLRKRLTTAAVTTPGQKRRRIQLGALGDGVCDIFLPLFRRWARHSYISESQIVAEFDYFQSFLTKIASDDISDDPHAECSAQVPKGKIFAEWHAAAYTKEQLFGGLKTSHVLREISDFCEYFRSYYIQTHLTKWAAFVAPAGFDIKTTSGTEGLIGYSKLMMHGGYSERKSKKSIGYALSLWWYFFLIQFSSFIFYHCSSNFSRFSLQPV